MDRYLSANAVLSKFSRNYMELKNGLPIRPSEMGVLNIITGTKGPHTPVMLSEKLGVSKPMITAHITSLESKGHIKKEPSARDKRVYYILPTEKALDLVESARVDMNGHLDRLIDGMGEDEFETLVKLAGMANSILDDKGE